MLDLQAKLKSLEGLEHLSELPQGQWLPIDDECHVAIAIGDPASHGLMGGLKVSGLLLLNMACCQRFADPCAKATECQIGTIGIKLSEEESLALLSFFLGVDPKPKVETEI